MRSIRTELLQLTKTGYFPTAKTLAEELHVTDRHVRNLICEIEEEVRKGRYPKKSIMNTTPVRVNLYVFYDYLSNRERLKSSRRKYVDDFNPTEYAFLCPVVVVHES